MFRLEKLLTLVFVCALVSAATDPCFGQAFTANLTGLVTDPSNAVVPGARVKLRNRGTNETRQTESGPAGRYTLSQLLPGAYDLTVEANGFKTSMQQSIILRANHSAEANISLQPGDISESIHVAPTVVQLDTQTANQSVTLNKDMVQSLPINTRNPLALVNATAGITAPEVGVTQSVFDQNYNRFGINGGRTEASLILVDGVPTAAGTGFNGNLYSPSVDAVQEVQLIRNSYEAQFGKTGGGVVSVVTRGGTREFHGTAFEFLRNSAMDANTWANNRRGLQKPIFQRHQFGGNFAGPLWKSKRLFFFGNYEGLRQGTPLTTITTLPTALERQGDFSQAFNRDGSLAVIYNPFTTRPNPSGPGFIRDPFPGNRIPQNLLDPVGVRAVALYPQPNAPGDPITKALNYAATGKATAISDRADIRIDWAQSAKHTLYGRFSKAFRSAILPPPNIWLSTDATAAIHGNPRYHFTLGYTFVPDPTWVINVLAGHGSHTESQRSHTFGQDGTAIGLPPELVRQFDVRNIPQFWLEPLYSNISHSRDLSVTRRLDNLQVNVTKEKGLHSIKFGFAMESARETGGAPFSANFFFNRGMTSGPIAATNSSVSGNSIASLLLGAGSSGDVPKNALLATNRMYYAGYLQDAWRVNPRLTVNYGLRYEIQKPSTERFNRYSNFDYNVPNPLGQRVGLPLRGGLVFLDENNRYSWDPDWVDLAPRVGIALKITDKLVMRTGYGIFYPTVLGNGNSTGFSSTTPWVTSRGGDGLNPQDLLRNPFPQGLVPTIGSSLGLETNLGFAVGEYDRDIPSGYIQNYSLDFQYELNPTTLIELGYAGNQSRKLAFGITTNDNQLHPQFLALGPQLDQQVPNPFFGHIRTGILSGPTVPRHQLLRPYPHFSTVNRGGITPGASASYNALVAKVSKQFSSGLLLASYQWSKAIDDASERQAWAGGATASETIRTSVSSGPSVPTTCRTAS